MSTEPKQSGPLSGIRVLEMGGIGPGPFCAMLLADMGADVVRVEPPRAVEKGYELGGMITLPSRQFAIHRGRRSVGIDLKADEGKQVVSQLVEKMDVLLEGYRPGVMERMGLGPEALLERNPGLVYGRMTGYGQTGPMANDPGHDVNYLAMSGYLSMLGTKERPVTPPAGIADFGGGGMLLAVGLLSALVERSLSGQGQVVDAAMIDGASLFSVMTYSLLAHNLWRLDRASNIVDGGAPFYDVYRTQDGKWISVGAMEPKFFQVLLEVTGLREKYGEKQMDGRCWAEMRKDFTEIFLTRPRSEWDLAMEGVEACYAPVLGLDEISAHQHHQARGSFVTVDGLIQPAPAPRFSRTPGAVDRPPPHPGEHSLEVLADYGFAGSDIERLTAANVVKQAEPNKEGGRE
ncbi:MAG: CoA transferase [Gammaproteobacteria bacterium]|nr:CoA transferase [Gammaproteobacteria bacterium]